MCTILTVSQELFSRKPEKFKKHILKDASGNPHGFGLLLLGDKAEDTILMYGMEVDVLFLVMVTNSKWKRAWLHSRFATSSTINLFGCHPFSSVGSGRKGGQNSSIDDQFLIMHNGILRSKDADNFFVDSMYIAQKLRYNGVEDTLKYLLTETYANVFLVNPITGEWHMSRSSSGTLFTDGKDNYSSSAMKGVMSIPVPHNTQAKHKHQVALRQRDVYDCGWDYGYWNNRVRRHHGRTYGVSSSRSYTGYNSRDLEDEWEQDYYRDRSSYSNYSTTLTAKEANDLKLLQQAGFSSSEAKNMSVVSIEKGSCSWDDYYKDRLWELIKDLKDKMFDDLDEFIDLAHDMSWVYQRMPNAAYKALTPKQREWLRDLRQEVGMESLEDKEAEEEDRRTLVCEG